MILTTKDVNFHECFSLLGTIILSSKLSVFLKFKLYQMDVHNASLNRYLNEEVEDLIFANIMRNIVENKLSNNIYNVVNSSVGCNEGSILMNKDVHEGVTKDVVIGNLSLLNEDTVMKYLCQMRIALERMLPNKTLIFEEMFNCLRKSM